MSALLKDYAAIVLAGVLLLGIGAVGGWTLAANHYGAQLDTAQKQIADGSAAVARCSTARDSLAAGVDAQNQALVDLQRQASEVAEQAQAAQAEAESRARSRDQQAQAVLAERTPAGADACTAASKAFDNELAQERAK
ncbi:MAG: hypothetical protein GAK45_02338 [Pseudomonas citronellolis]|nr:MAG: hypothetical protein GAK45_02338 [Pseudomonas citronellolis]